MNEIFEVRIQNFMRTSKEMLKSTRENYVVELRKNKRNSLYLEKRKIPGGNISEKYCVDEEALMANLADLHEWVQTNLSEIQRKGLKLSQGNRKDFRGNLELTLPCLLEFLDSEDRELISSCLSFFMMVSFTDEYMDLLVKFNLHGVLLNALDKCIDDYDPFILHVLINMSADDPCVSEKLIECGFLNQLYSIVRNNKSAFETASHALVNTFCFIENHDKINLDLATKICKLVITNRSTLKNCLFALIKLIKEANDHTTLICFIPYIIDALKSQECLQIALVLIKQISSQDSILNQLLLKAEILNSFLEVLKSNPQEKADIFFILSNIIVGDALDISIFLSHEIKKIVHQGITDPNEKIRIECSYIYKNVLFQATALQKSCIFTKDFFLQLVHILGSHIITDNNYLECVISGLQTPEIHDKIYDLYQSSGVHEKLTSFSLNCPFETRVLANSILKDFQ